MPQITFAASIQRHVATPPRDVAAATVGAALHAVFAEQPQLRGYILDDQGRLRRHLAVFIDGHPICDRRRLTDTLAADSSVYVVQALSGG